MPTFSPKSLRNRISREIINALKTAEVTLVVTKFKDVLKLAELPEIHRTLVTFPINPAAFRTHREKFTKSLSTLGQNQGTEHEMSVEPHSRVSIRKNKPLTLRIRPGGATIHFAIVTPSGGAKAYYPVGIAFVRNSKPGYHRKDKDRIGRLNFLQSQIRPEGNCLYITDSFKDETHDDRYKFSVIIQRVRDGAIGIIDPGIDHTNH